MRPAKRLTLASVGVTVLLWPGMTAYAGSARDYLNAPVDTWLLNYNAGYTTSVTPEDGTDTVPGVRSNVFAQSVVLTRIMDYWGRTGGLSIVLPYALVDTSAGPFRASTNGVSDVDFLWQMNILGGPALTRVGRHGRERLDIALGSPGVTAPFQPRPSRRGAWSVAALTKQVRDLVGTGLAARGPSAK